MLIMAAGLSSCSDDDDKTPLASPAVTCEATYDTLTFSWNAVANATNYGYQFCDAEGLAIEAGVTENRTVTFTELTPDTSYILKVWAFAGMDGDYSTEASSLTAKTDPVDVNVPLWTVKGTYYSAQLDQSWTAYMDYYYKDHYVIRAFYGVDGYDMDIKIDTSDADDTFSFLNGQDTYLASYYTWEIPTGLTATPTSIYALPWDDYCYMEGERTNGIFYIGNRYGRRYTLGYDTFTWPAE